MIIVLATIKTTASNIQNLLQAIVDMQVDVVGGGGIQGYAYFAADSFIDFDVIDIPGCKSACIGDLNDDTTVNTSDLLELFENTTSIFRLIQE